VDLRVKRLKDKDNELSDILFWIDFIIIMEKSESLRVKALQTYGHIWTLILDPKTPRRSFNIESKEFESVSWALCKDSQAS
jgi:hypothetical protein